MQKFFLSCLLIGALVSCAPVTTAYTNTAPIPVIIKTSNSASVGQEVRLQGRYLGSPTTSHVLLSAKPDSLTGYRIPAEAIVSWTDTEIVFRVPANVPTQGLWISVITGNVQSGIMPFSIKQ